MRLIASHIFLEKILKIEFKDFDMQKTRKKVLRIKTMGSQFNIIVQDEDMDKTIEQIISEYVADSISK